MTTYRARELSDLVGRALKVMPVVTITGLRQAGKTTFLQEDKVFQGRQYFTLDDLGTLAVARREPEALVRGSGPVIIDEVQRCPELLLAVKREVDRQRSPGRFVLSGSASLALLGKISESLAGRALYLTLHPFTRREQHGELSESPFIVQLLSGFDLSSTPAREPISGAEILAGGMPPVILCEAPDRNLWFLGYEQTYLERDVRDLSQVALVAFRHLLRLAAHHTGRILNQSELAREARLPVSTASRYLNLLETSFVLTRLAPHLRSPASRLIKSPKIFFTDAGLAGYLSGVRELGAGPDEPLRGPLFETYVLQNLAGILDAHLPEAELTFWSIQGRHQVELVITLGCDSLAVSVRPDGCFSDRDVHNLRAFAGATPGVKAAILAYNGAETVKISDGMYAIPIALLLS